MQRVNLALSIALALILSACGGAGPTVSTGVSASPSPSVEPSSSRSTEPLAVEVIETGPGPISLAATSESIWVELHRDDLVALIDPATNKQVEETAIAVHCGLASSGETVWATIAKLNQVTSFAASTGEAVQAFAIPSACGVAAEGETAWVTSPGDAAVYLLKEGTAEPIQRIGVAPDIFGIALDETSAWVTSESEGGTLWRIDRATYDVTRVGQFAGVGPDSVEVALGAVWLNSRPDGHLWKVNPADGMILGQVDLREPAGVEAVGESLWVVLYGGGLVQLDPDTLEILLEQRLPEEFLGPPLYAFGSLWISALEANKVLRIPTE
jgi:hypothetical protein